MPPDMTIGSLKNQAAAVQSPREFLELAQDVQAAHSLDGAKVSEPEYQALEQAYQNLDSGEKFQARVALRRNFPELHGHVINDHK